MSTMPTTSATLAAYVPRRGATWPFGDTWDGQCNTVYGMRSAVVTGSDEECQGGVPGLYDMGGNLAEWSATCTNSDCYVYGGDFNQSDDQMTCDNPGMHTCTYSFGSVGFRCCASLRL